jgi:thiazole synthase
MNTETTRETDTRPDPLVLGDRTFRSRLLVGTGKYSDHETMNAALSASGCEVVTVAIRRVDLSSEDNLLTHLDRDRYFLLPNTAGCFNAEDAIRVCHLSRELGLGDWVKLEVLGDKQTLLPDPIGTLDACKTLVAEGFKVLVYSSDDPVMALRLQDAGATSVMPAGSPIGSGQGILNRNNLAIILEQLDVPVIIDAGVGTASDVTIAMELGAEGVLLNTGIAGAQDPIAMAHAMRHALDAGWYAARAGRIPRRRYAQASSPTEGVLGE